MTEDASKKQLLIRGLNGLRLHENSASTYWHFGVDNSETGHFPMVLKWMLGEH